MPSQRLHGGFVVFCLLLGCRWGWAIDPSQSTMVAPGGDFNGPGNPPAMIAMPVETGTSTSPTAGGISTAPLDASNYKKFYTITATLRETYDDNVETSATNKIAAFETGLTPSVLVNIPTTGGSFSGRYTFGLTYYTHGGGQNSVGPGSNQPSLEYTHELVAQYAKAFSDRYSVSLAEQFRYYTEPSLFESTGTVFRDGAYVSNAFNGAFSAQWTPLFSTTTTYANTIIKYEEADVAQEEDSIENTGSQSFNFAVTPKVTASVGVIGDDITYDDVERGYSNYTLFAGVQWQILPSMSLSVRGGGSYTEPAEGQGLLSPYAAVDFSWALGSHSSLTFDYSHEVSPNDEPDSNGELADRFGATFVYVVNPDLSVHLNGIYTNATTAGGLINSDQISNYGEQDYSLETGGAYHYDKYIDIDFGIIISGVISGLSDRDYDRHQVYVGIRGTY